MSFLYTNKHKLSVALAVWLAQDDYDYAKDESIISATTLLKSTKAICLAKQNTTLSKQVDLSDLVASRMGTALHDSIERSWLSKKLPETLAALGYGNVTKKIVINPTELTSGEIPIYLEQRSIRKVGNLKVSGKFDICIDGKLGDYKSTSVWKLKFGDGQDYILQGSIYRWLNPEIITEDKLDIHYIFTDWSKQKALQDSKYPQTKALTKEYRLLSLEEIDSWITNKIQAIEDNLSVPEEQMPECTGKELWARPTVYKYYKNPSKLTRAIKNFDSYDEALIRQGQDGNVGIVKEVKGHVGACISCNVVGICEQYQQLLSEGRIK